MRDLHTLDKYRLVYDEIKLYGMDTIGEMGKGNGCFKVYVAGRSFFAVASDGGGWDHVSVSPCSKKRQTCPTWEEMCEIKDMFFEPEEAVVQYHPARSEYVNNHPFCLHLWRPNDGTALPTPPRIFV